MEAVLVQDGILEVEGAGGYREAKATGDPYTSGPLAVAGGLPVSASPGAYPIVIGGGGTGGPHPGNNPGTDGALSSFSTIIRC